MLFLLLLLPAIALGWVLAWLSWRARHRRVALTIAGFSLLGSAAVAALVCASWIFIEGLVCASWIFIEG